MISKLATPTDYHNNAKDKCCLAEGLGLIWQLLELGWFHIHILLLSFAWLATVDACWPWIRPILTMWWLLHLPLNTHLTHQQYLRTHALSPCLCLCLHHLAFETHSLVLSIFRHIKPQISLPTRLRLPRTASAVVARRLKDGEVGPSTLAMLDRIFVYGFYIPSYIYRLFFL